MLVHAPKDARSQGVLWDKIICILFLVGSWLIGGGFNNVENAFDVRVPCILAILQSYPHSMMVE